MNKAVGTLVVVAFFLYGIAKFVTLHVVPRKED